MQGNVLDLAIGVVIGGAFTAIVKAIVEGLITPLVGLVISLFGVKNMEKMSYTFNGVEFGYGMVISAIITFFITAIVVFAIVKAVNKARDMSGVKKEEEVEDEMEATEQLLMEIRDLLSKK